MIPSPIFILFLGKFLLRWSFVLFVERFMAWSVSVGTEQRADAITRLAKNFLDDRIADDERDGALQVMTLYLDDPCCRVRAAMAKAISQHSNAPRTLVWSLAEDVAEVSSHVFQYCDQMRSADLLHELKRGECLTQIAVANRENVDGDAIRYLVAEGCERAVEALLKNELVVLSPCLLHEVAARLGDCAAIRAELLMQVGLEARTRQILVERVSSSLVNLATSSNWIGNDRLSKIANDACNRSALEIAERVNPVDMKEYVEHLGNTNQLTTALLVRAACSGHAAFMEAAFSILSGMSLKRVQAIVDDARTASFKSMYQRTGLPVGAYNLFKAAVQVWQKPCTAADALNEIVSRVENDPGVDGALFSLLGRMSGEASRENAANYERQLLLAA